MPVSKDNIEDFIYNLENTAWNYKPTKSVYKKLSELQDLLVDFLGYFEDKVIDDLKSPWSL